MDYEKKYKEALELARVAAFNGHQSLMEGIFTELKESEDEKIRKEIMEYITLYKDSLDDNEYNSWLAWLEKQKPIQNINKEDEEVRQYIIRIMEQRDINVPMVQKALTWLEKQEGCEYIKKDWLEHIKQSWYKEGFIDGKYTPKELTINDAATLNELIDFLENGTVKLQHDLTLYANWLKTQFSPNEKQGEQKPAWSEEDENRINHLIAYFEDKEGFTAEDDIAYANWLKSLKGRTQPKQDWNEEDEKMFRSLHNLIYVVPDCDCDSEKKLELSVWFNSLKERYAWKPSDEQIKALHDLNLTGNISYVGQGQVLIGLYNDLKKLKGE